MREAISQILTCMEEYAKINVIPVYFQQNPVNKQ